VFLSIVYIFSFAFFFLYTNIPDQPFQRTSSWHSWFLFHFSNNHSLTHTLTYSLNLFIYIYIILFCLESIYTNLGVFRNNVIIIYICVSKPKVRKALYYPVRTDFEFDLGGWGSWSWWYGSWIYNYLCITSYHN